MAKESTFQNLISGALKSTRLAQKDLKFAAKDTQSEIFLNRAGIIEHDLKSALKDLRAAKTLVEARTNG